MKTGDKVVCVNDNFQPIAYERFDRIPNLGEVYVLRDVLEYGGELGVRLIGVNGTISPNHCAEYCFHACRFRLLQEMKEESKAKAFIANPAPLPIYSRHPAPDQRDESEIARSV